MMAQLLQSRMVKFGFISRVLAIIVALVTVVVLFVAVESHARRTSLYVSPTATEVRDALLRCGFGPDALAAAGVSVNETSDIIEAISAHLSEHPGAIDVATAQWKSARAQVDQLERIMRAGRATQEQATQLSQARTAAAAAEASMEAAIDAAIADAELDAELASEQRQMLAKLRGNDRWHMPLEILSVDREQEQWVAIRDALAIERIAAKFEEEVDPAAAALLTQVRSDNAVSTAAANLASNLAAITARWMADTSPQ